MRIDSRLNEIDDCLYRVAVRALVIQDDKVLLVKEAQDRWWALPGGGMDHGETVESSLVREMEEELGVPAKEISSDFQIAHYNIGSIVNGIPRMNIFFKVSVPESLIKKTSYIARWRWSAKEDFLGEDLHPSYNKLELADIIFAVR